MLKLIIRCLVFIVALFSVVNAFAGLGSGVSKPSKLYLIAVGIDKYTDKRWQEMKFAKADAVSLADEFSKRGKYGEIYKTVLLDEDANKNAIEQAFAQIAREADENDYFIFVHAGYGFHENDLKRIKPDLKVKNNQYYFIPSDVNLDRLDETTISGNFLHSMVRKIRARNKLIISDSCSSATSSDSTATSYIEKDPNAERYVGENTVFWGTDTVSLELPDKGHGQLTSVILDGLSGKADYNSDGDFSVYELEAYIYQGSLLFPKFHSRSVAKGENFFIGYTDKKLKELASRTKTERESTKDKRNAVQSEENNNPTRAKLAGNVEPKKEEKRSGKDYALLFANDVYENGWTKLSNPRRDVNEIARQLKERYGFESISIKENLGAQDIYTAIKDYQKISFNPDDQLFVFFAGHGVSDEYNNGYFVARDSPAELNETNGGQFVALELVLKIIDRIPSRHTMVMFDACYAGKVWSPSLKVLKGIASNEFPKNRPENPFLKVGWNGSNQNSFGFSSASDDDQISIDSYIKRRMKNFTRIVMTSGDNTVPDGKTNSHSPFARQFINALESNGGDDNVLIFGEIKNFVDKLNSEPQYGTLGDSDGDFVFIRKSAVSDESR